MTLDEQFPSPAQLSPAEQVIYQMVYEAAELGLPCPVNIDLEVAAGFNSTSMGPKTIARLKAKGLIDVQIFSNRYRRVQVIATGKWTAFDPRQKSFGAHVPRRKVIGAVTEGGGTYRIGGE